MIIRTAFIQAFYLFTLGSLWAEPGGDGHFPGISQFFDDGAFREIQTVQGRDLQVDGKLVSVGDLSKQLARRSVSLTLPEAQPADSPLSLRDLYRKCRQSVFSIAEVRGCEGCGETHVTPFGTGFAISADGVLLTNLHLITELGSKSRLVASTTDGTTYPVVEVVASSERDDATVIRIDASGLKPLPLSADNQVGTRVSVISNPRGHLFSLSEGIVTRLFTQSSKRLMHISAEIAVGSSGAPVIDSSGNVVGMVATGRPLNDQMIVRGCIPSQSLLELVTDADFGMPEEVYDPHATERACMEATFAAMKQLAEQRGKIPSKELNQKMVKLLAVMKYAAERCPNHPVAKQFSRFTESRRKPSESRTTRVQE